MCSYHGWEFSGSGTCTNIPQAQTQEANERACSNPRSCAKVYPCKVRTATASEVGRSAALWLPSGRASADCCGSTS